MILLIITCLKPKKLKSRNESKTMKKPQLLNQQCIDTPPKYVVDDKRILDEQLCSLEALTYATREIACKTRMLKELITGEQYEFSEEISVPEKSGLVGNLKQLLHAANKNINIALNNIDEIIEL